VSLASITDEILARGLGPYGAPRALECPRRAEWGLRWEGKTTSRPPGGAASHRGSVVLRWARGRDAPAWRRLCVRSSAANGRGSQPAESLWTGPARSRCAVS